ncbi:unnamed protein product [Caenorhabditis angaria]|uniref:Uncharacterized protein n=1 Tax=Caenorhabditis angaria TaxID=860376 RepID=A0A9P1N7I1_9PELO|nr:unnamed protein product [Caenorhabditis angaria]
MDEVVPIEVDGTPLSVHEEAYKTELLRNIEIIYSQSPIVQRNYPQYFYKCYADLIVNYETVLSSIQTKEDFEAKIDIIRVDISSLFHSTMILINRQEAPPPEIFEGLLWN